MKLELDGERVEQTSLPGQSLLSWIRAAGATAPKQACGTGDCGACTVALDGVVTTACLFPVHRAEGRTVETLAAPNEAREGWKERWRAAEAFQCGFCTSGAIMTLADADGGEPEVALKGSLCRCTGYAAFADAIEGRNRIEEAGIGGCRGNIHGEILLAGRSRYTAETVPADALHLAVWRSPWAHARIEKIDISAARAYPGVVEVYSPDDVPDMLYSSGCHALPELDPPDMRMLDREVRFVGQRVIAVVATSLRAAREAVDLIRVEADVREPVLTLKAAAQGSVLVHPELPGAKTNVVAEVNTRSASWSALHDRATAPPERRSFTTHRAQHVHLEPHIAWAHSAADGGLHVVTSTQVPFLVREKLARLLGLPLDAVRVEKPLVGGGFGNKQEMLVEDLVAWTARRLNRPVVWEFTREEEFVATTSRHPMELETVVLQDVPGDWLGLGLGAMINTGAYGNHAPGVLHCALFEGVAPYRLATKKAYGKAYYTHTLPAGAFRGYGGSQGAFAVECTVEELAHAANVHPLDFRRRYLVRAGDELGFGDGGKLPHAIDENALEACLDAVKTWSAKGVPDLAGDAWATGLGYSICLLTAGPGPMHRSEASAEWTDGGRLRLATGAADVGTGTDTLLTGIAAAVSGLSVSAIELVAADTGKTRYDAGSFASATATVAGEAVRRAVHALCAQLRSGGATTEDGGIDWEQAGGLPSAQRRAESSFAADETAVSFAVMGAAVAVDQETGQVRVLDTCVALDAGTILDPVRARGQVEGAVMMALGWTLWEELHIGDDGAVHNSALRSYRLPGFSDRIRMTVRFFEQADPRGPFGAKALGELASNVVAPAVTNAVNAAIGKPIRDLPLAPWRVLEVLQP